MFLENLSNTIKKLELAKNSTINFDYSNHLNGIHIHHALKHAGARLNFSNSTGKEE